MEEMGGEEKRVHVGGMLFQQPVQTREGFVVAAREDFGRGDSTDDARVSRPPLPRLGQDVDGLVGVFLPEERIGKKLVGERRCALAAHRELHVAGAGGSWQRVPLQSPTAGDAHPSRGPLGAWAREVIAAIQAGKQIAPSFEDGLRCQAVVDAAHRSHAQSGRWVPVERD